MNVCKFCNSGRLVKDGKVRGKQRYRCKDCCREQVEGDGRVKYENKIKKSAVVLYLEGNGMRAIARILSEIFETRIYFQTIAKWLKQAGHIVEEEVRNMQTTDKVIDIVEMDELFTYIKKNKIRSEYGLLLTGMNSVYLNLKSVAQKSRHG
jgi:transposase-like protein